MRVLMRCGWLAAQGCWLVVMAQGVGSHTGNCQLAVSAVVQCDPGLQPDSPGLVYTIFCRGPLMLLLQMERFSG